MSIAPPPPARLALATAALVLAALSRGDALVLAALLAVAAWQAPAAAALVTALVASSWRWGSTSLEALAGAQGVLGPAGLVGPPAAAATSWLAAATVVLAAPRLNLPRGATMLVMLAWGAAAAAVVAGPAPGGALWVRFVAWTVATVIALGVALLRRHARWRGALDVCSLVAAVSALALVTRDAPGWSTTVDGAAIGTASVVGGAVAGLVLVGGRTLVAMRERRA